MLILDSNQEKMQGVLSQYRVDKFQFSSAEGQTVQHQIAVLPYPVTSSTTAAASSCNGEKF
jgi:hypothetical protein